jgi:hypothetical protein
MEQEQVIKAEQRTAGSLLGKQHRAVVRKQQQVAQQVPQHSSSSRRQVWGHLVPVSHLVL